MRLRGRSAGTCAPVGMSPRDAFAGGDIPVGPVRLRGYSSQNPCTSEMPCSGGYLWRYGNMLKVRAVVEADPTTSFT